MHLYWPESKVIVLAMSARPTAACSPRCCFWSFISALGKGLLAFGLPTEELGLEQLPLGLVCEFGSVVETPFGQVLGSAWRLVFLPPSTAATASLFAYDSCESALRAVKAMLESVSSAVVRVRDCVKITFTGYRYCKEYLGRRECDDAEIGQKYKAVT